MSNNTFTLDAMRAEIEKEFAPFTMDLGDGKVVVLRNLLRIPKKNRDTIYALLDDLNELQKNDEDSGLVNTEKSAQIALEIIPLVADSEKLGRQLVEAIEEDLALTLRVFSSWMGNGDQGKADS
jgi:hypothetical protein